MKELILDRAEALHERLGTAGFVLSIVAICLALTGGAFAASKYVTKKEAEKIAKKFAGKPGAEGKQGPAGANGKDGINGANGANGTDGSDGESVTVAESANAFGSHCNNTTSGKGGSEFKVGATTTYACNGKNGTTGFTETLPSNKTETGAWSIGPLAPSIPAFLTNFAPISFNIPLAAALDATHVHYIKVGETAPAGCTGGTAAAPTAEAGNLCVYTAEKFGVTFEGIDKAGAPEAGVPAAEGASPQGALILFKGSEEGIAYGTWAVTAP